MRKAKYSKFGSITGLMKETLKQRPEIKFEQALSIVKRSFPSSRFNERHLSWYKSAYKRGVLKGVR